MWQNFKRNLSKVNGGNDFDEEMLDEVYIAIKYVQFTVASLRCSF